MNVAALKTIVLLARSSPFVQSQPFAMTIGRREKEKLRKRELEIVGSNDSNGANDVINIRVGGRGHGCTRYAVGFARCWKRKR